MSTTDDRRSQPLPVTNEIGSEGGSFGDPTMQVATFEEPEKDHRAPGVGGPGSAAQYAIRRDDIVEWEDSRPAGVVRYPTEEPPEGAPPTRAHDRRDGYWGAGLVGAAAGLALGLLAARRR